MRAFLVAAAAVSIALTGVACKSATPYAAKVNGVTLTRSGLDNELNAIRGNKKYLAALEQQVTVKGTGADTFDAQFVAQVLNRRIYLELIHQEVVRRKLKITAADLAAAREQLVSSIGDPAVIDAFPKAYYNEIRRTTAEVTALQNALADTGDANLRKYYDEHRDNFEKACAAHILVDTKAEADSIEKDLAKAADKKATFAEIAKAKSKDTGSGANGGDLGCASPSGYVQEFKDAVRAQKIGEIGPPVKTQFGYHIIRVDSRDPAPPFEQVKEQVKAAITDTQQGPFTDFLDKAGSSAKIEVNPRYGKFDKSGQSPHVVPPKSPDAVSTTAANPSP
ncbi:MAG: peptidyl-prolyl cis-trans isomerase [Actinomycetota bacterium]|jgi:foldase protein PrsA